MEVWIGRDGARHGPYNESDVRDWLRAGTVSGDDLGWYEGLSDWQPLRALFADALPAAGTTPPPHTTAALPPTTTLALEDYAGFWRRVGAYVLDAIILWIPNTIVKVLMGSAVAEEALQQQVKASAGDLHAVVFAYHTYLLAMGPTLFILTIVTWLYFSICESSSWQATPGKLALGIRVTNEQGARISFLRATGRFFAKYLSTFILGIGYLMVAWTRRKQGLHDLVASTLVLNGRASQFKQTNAPSRTAGNGTSFNA